MSHLLPNQCPMLPTVVPCVLKARGLRLGLGVSIALPFRMLSTDESNYFVCDLGLKFGAKSMSSSNIQTSKLCPIIQCHLIIDDLL